MHLQESGEMYLETILVLTSQSPHVRAMGLLKNGGYIKVDENGFITLLEPGREVAEMIYERHTLLTQFLTRLGVSPEVAAEDACKLEHVISDESFQAIKKHAHLGVEK